MVLFGFQFYPVTNLIKFINFRLGTVRSDEGLFEMTPTSKTKVGGFQKKKGHRNCLLYSSLNGRVCFRSCKSLRTFYMFLQRSSTFIDNTFIDVAHLKFRNTEFYSFILLCEPLKQTQ